MATIRLIPSAYTLSNTTYMQISDATNMYADTDSTTYAQITHNRASATTFYAYVHGFNFNDVPSDAVVDSFTIKIKASENALSTSTAYTMSLYNNTTAIANTSASSLSTTVTTYTFPNGNLTWSTLKGYGNNFRIRVPLRRNSTNTSGYVRIYGAEIEVNYRGTEYGITSISNTDLVESIIPEGTTTVYEGDDYTLNIYADSISNVIVEDNGTDVTSQLVRKENTDTGGTVSSVAQSTFTTGGSPTNVSFYTASTSTTTEFLQYPIGYTAESPRSTSITNTYVKSSSNTSGSTGWIIFDFDFSSIPENATIDSVQVKCYGSKESTQASTTSVTRVSKVGLYSGTVLKSTEQEFTSTANTIMTISNPGTWTRAELQNAKLRFTVGYYGGYMAGITWNVTYSVPATTQYYWEYTLSNVSADHTIMISEDIIVPPDEDPAKEYFPVTISSINATTDPKKGTTRVESGTTETIKITPSDPQLTLAIDNGVDITSQLVQHGGTIQDPTVTTAPGASYGFTYSASTGYYVSANKGVDKSAAVCVVNFDLPARCLVTISYINYAEATYDFGVFGNIDVPLTNDYKPASGNMPDSDYKLACNTSTYNVSSVQTITYEIPSGQHQVYIKYMKDDATSSNNDTLQWKITSIEPLESVVGYYTYTLSNINQQHSLIFIFGNVTYYFVNSTANGDCTLYPNGSMVQLPGDEYRLTIVPNESGDTVTLTDNNTDVTSQLERKEVQTEKDGVTTTVVNYIYRISNIQATHNINVISTPQGLDSYIRTSNQWKQGEILMKEDGRWNSLRYTRIWVHNGTAWVENAQRTITTKGIRFGGVISS